MIGKSNFAYKKKETFNLKQEIFKYTKNWRWFILSIILFVTAAFFYARYNPTVYETTARVRVINQKVNEIELPGNLNSLFEDSKVNLENEVEIIKSYRILEQVSEKLDLNVRYYNVTKVKSEQVWNLPIKVIELDSLMPLPTSGVYIIDILEKGYLITDALKKQWKVPFHNIDIPFNDLPFLLKVDKANFKNLTYKKIKVRFFSIREATLRLLSGIRVERLGKYSEILKLSVRNESSQKSEAILNQIIKQFNEDGVNDRRLIFQRTIDFVDERFEYLTKELDSIENTKKQFKENNNLSDINLDIEHTLSDKSVSNSERVELETQLEVAKILRNTLANKESTKLLPVDVGLGISGINDQIILFNKNILEFRKIKTSAGSNNPIVVNLKKDINNLRNNILASVVAYQRKSQSALKNIKNVDRNNTGFFRAIPKKEKVLREIEREQSIKENLFIFLLQRREEAAINLVITAPTVKVVDYAITNLIPVSEGAKKVYLKAFIAGIVVPFIILYLIFFVDTKIHTREDVLANIETNKVIGEIPYSYDKKLFNGKTDNSSLAEGFRILRTNINYLIKNLPKKESANVLMVTSSKEDEGKTFCAINLAISYAVLNKKVLLIDTNFRNPKIQSHLKTIRDKQEGLSNYLQEDLESYKDLISSFSIGKTILHILTTGLLPSAPAELLSNGKLESLINSVKNEYDYIVLDTSCTSLVTDTLVISETADITLNIIKSDFTNKKDIKLSEELIVSQKLKNVSYVLNGVTPNTLF